MDMIDTLMTMEIDLRNATNEWEIKKCYGDLNNKRSRLAHAERNKAPLCAVNTKQIVLEPALSPVDFANKAMMPLFTANGITLELPPNTSLRDVCEEITARQNTPTQEFTAGTECTRHYF